MSLIGSLLAEARVKRAPVAYRSYLPSMGLASGSAKTEDYLNAYGQIGWLYACVSRISAAVGETEWYVERGPSDDAETIDDHPAMQLLSDANPFMTGQELFELLQMHLDLAGNGFWVLNADRRKVPLEIWPVLPQHMRIVPSRQDFIQGYVYRNGTEEIPFEPWEVIHFKYPNPNDLYTGLGPVQALAIDLDTEVYSSKWNRNFFVNSARPDAVLEAPDGLSDEEFERLQKQWAEEHQGVDRAHRVAVLEKATYKPMSPTQVDMGWVDQRRLNRDQILGAYGMPHAILGIVDDVNRANAETAEYVFARWVLQPRLQRIRAKLNETLIPMFGQGDRLCYVDPTPENREQSRQDAESGMKSGYMMRDEARDLMQMDAMPNKKRGRVFLLPLATREVPADEDPESPPASGGPAAPTPAGMPPTEMPPAEMPPDQEPQRSMRRSLRRALDEAAKDRLIDLFVKRLDSKEQRWQQPMLDYYAEEEAAVLAALATLEGKAVKVADPEPEPIDWDSLLNWAYLLRRLQEIGQPLITVTLDEAALEAVADYALGIDWNLHNPRVTEWIGDRLKRFSTAVNDTQKTEITSILREAERNGESIAQMREKIRPYYSGNSKFKAERVARTETIYASNQGAIESYRQAGITQWEWWATLDERLCELCRPLHSTLHAIAQAFEPPHPQCRCAALPVVPD